MNLSVNWPIKSMLIRKTFGKYEEAVLKRVISNLEMILLAGLGCGNGCLNFFYAESIYI